MAIETNFQKRLESIKATWDVGRKISFENDVDKGLNRGMKFSKEDLEMLYNRFGNDGLKKDYLKAVDEKDTLKQSEIMRKVQDDESSLSKIKRRLNVFAKKVLYGDEGVGEDLKISSTGQDLGKIISGKIQPTQDKEDNWGFEISLPQHNADNLRRENKYNFAGELYGKKVKNKKWLNMRELEGLVNKHSFDKQSKSVIDSTRTNMMNKASEEDAGDFNYEVTFDSVKNNIIQKGNLNSLTFHKGFIGDREFYEDLKSHIKGNTYEKLGIDPSLIKDPTPKDGKLTDGDIGVIADNVLKNKEMHVNYLAAWVTNHLSKNWDVGAKSRKKKDDGITLYSEFGKQGGDVGKAKEYNMKTYGTHNPTLDSKKLNISLPELAQRKKQKDAMDLIKNNPELSDEEKVARLKLLHK